MTAAAEDPSENMKEIFEIVKKTREMIRMGEGNFFQLLKQTRTLTANPKSDLEKGRELMRDTSSRMRADEDNAEERQHSPSTSFTSIQPSTRPPSSRQDDNVTEPELSANSSNFHSTNRSDNL